MEIVVLIGHLVCSCLCINMSIISPQYNRVCIKSNWFWYWTCLGLVYTTYIVHLRFTINHNYLLQCCLIVSSFYLNICTFLCALCRCCAKCITVLSSYFVILVYFLRKWHVPNWVWKHTTLIWQNLIAY